MKKSNALKRMESLVAINPDTPATLSQVADLMRSVERLMGNQEAFAEILKKLTAAMGER